MTESEWNRVWGERKRVSPKRIFSNENNKKIE